MQTRVNINFYFTTMNGIRKYLTAVMAVFALTAADLHAELPLMSQSILPNIDGKSLTTPVGWGAAYGTIFAGAGAVSRAPYIHGPAFTNNVGDGAAAIGLGIGNPTENLGIQAVLTQYDVSQFDRYGMSFQLHRYLGSARSVAVGVENIMFNSASDSQRSYYAVYSQGVLADAFINPSTGTTSLHYSIGVGNGQYANKSSDDIITGHGAHGTYVFANAAYELFHELNFITEWSGTNLNAGLSKTFLITKSIPVVLTVGVLDLTSNTGDGVRYLVAMGTAVSL